MNDRRRNWIAHRVNRAIFAVLVVVIWAGLGWLGQRFETETKGAHAAAKASPAIAETNEMNETSVVAPQEVGLRVEWSSDPVAPRPGQLVTLTYRVFDSQTGAVISDLPLSHERPMHLILVSRDLAHFAHVHPEVDADGTYHVTTTPPVAGVYLLFNEFQHAGQTVLDQREVMVGDSAPGATALTQDLAPKTVGDVTVRIEAPEQIRANEAVQLTFVLNRGNRPVTDLEPYLGAAAHVAVVAADATGFTHTHGEAVAAGADHHGQEADHGDTHAVPNAFGPAVRVVHTFPEPGHYKIWAQFGHGGRVLTVPFTVEVR